MTGKTNTKTLDACRKAAETALGITPFDVQLTAAVKLYEKKIKENPYPDF